MQIHILAVILGAGLLACQGSSFSSKTGSNSAGRNANATNATGVASDANPQQSLEHTDPNSGDSLNPTNSDINAVIGGTKLNPAPNTGLDTAQGCSASNGSVVDANATFSFTSATRAGDEIATHLNSLSKYTSITAGAANYDADTATIVCKSYGYLKSTSMVEGNFSSPANNTIAKWNPAVNNLMVQNAQTAGNHTLKGIVCQGKLKPDCAGDLTWAFKK